MNMCNMHVTGKSSKAKHKKLFKNYKYYIIQAIIGQPLNEKYVGKQKNKFK